MTRTRTQRLRTGAALALAFATIAPLAIGSPARGSPPVRGLAPVDASGTRDLIFQPVTGTFPTGAYRRTSMGTHRVVVIPMYSRELPDLASLPTIMSKVKAFWQAQVPGLTFAYSIRKPVRLASGPLCDVYPAWRVAQSLSGLGGLETGEHVIVVAPECRIVGYAEERPGAGRVFVGVIDERVIAHEFGHNLGLIHADVLTCTKSGVRVSLGGRCVEHEYEDLADVMAAGIPVPLKACTLVNPVEQALLTGRVTKVAARGITTVTMNRGGSGIQGAQIPLTIGTLFMGPAVSGCTYERTSGVEARIATHNGSALLSVPDADGTVTASRTVLELGDSWSIPRTHLRAVVTLAGITRAVVRYVPADVPYPAPLPATITTPADGLVSETDPSILGWSPSPSTDVIAYQVQVGSEIVARVPASMLQTVIEPIGAPTVAVVWSVSVNGVRTPSPAVQLTPGATTWWFTATGDKGELTIPGPSTVTWSVTPAATAALITSWQVTLNGTTVDLPGGTPSIVVDPVALGMNPLDYAELQVDGRDASGRTVTGVVTGIRYQP
jgi:hypothetical protein